jgi:hypothetical protein
MCLPTGSRCVRLPTGSRVLARWVPLRALARCVTHAGPMCALADWGLPTPPPHHHHHHHREPTGPRSGFGDGMGHTLEKTELEAVLRSRGITDVFVCGACPAREGGGRVGTWAVRCRCCSPDPAPPPPAPERTAGLALDYCVAFSCKDAVKAGFNAWLIHDATRGIAPDSMAREMAAMRSAGVHVLDSADDVPTADVEEAARKGGPGGAVGRSGDRSVVLPTVAELAAPTAAGAASVALAPPAAAAAATATAAPGAVSAGGR